MAEKKSIDSTFSCKRLIITNTYHIELPKITSTKVFILRNRLYIKEEVNLIVFQNSKPSPNSTPVYE